MSFVATVSNAKPTLANHGAVDANYKNLADQLNDNSGNVSAAEKSAVLREFRKGGWSLGGTNQATREYVSRAVGSSGFVARGNELYNALNAQFAERSVDQVHKSSSDAKIRLDYFDRLSPDDQMAFASSAGDTPEDWRATTMAKMEMHNRLEAARESGELGLDGKPTGKASAALSLLIEASDNFDKLDKTDKAALNAWTLSVNEMSDRPSAVRIDLSDDAKAYLNRK